MKHIFRVGLILLLLALVIPASAQDFGLGDEALQRWLAANGGTFNETQWRFDVTSFYTLDSGDSTADMAITGSGVLDIENEQASLTLEGTFTSNGETAIVDAELRVIGETIYVRFADPGNGADSGWFSIDTNELDGIDFDPATLGDIAAEGAGIGDVDTDAVTGALFGLAAVDPTSFITITNSAEGDNERFSVEISLSNLASTPGVAETAAAVVEAAGGPPIPPEQVSEGAGLVSQFLAETFLTVDQVIGGGLVRGADISLITTLDPSLFGAPDDPANVVFTIEVALSGYGEPANLETPADVTPIPGSVIEGALSDAGLLGASTGGDADMPLAVAASGGSIEVGQSGVYDIPADGTVSLSLNTTDTVTITVAGITEGTDPNVTVLDASGNELASNDDQSGFDNLGVFDSAVSDVAIPGSATIQIGEFSGNAGQVEVTVTSTATGGADAGGAVAPSTGTITVGQSGVYDVPADGTLSLTLETTDTVTITVAGITEGTDPNVTVLDASGNELASNDDQSGFDNLGVFDSAVSDVAIPGSATIQIGEFSGDAGQVEVTVTSAGSSGADAGGAAAPSTGTVTAVGPLECSTNATGIEGETGASFTATCPASCAGAAIWGTGTYTDDSSICVAAIHAGVLDKAGGEVTFTIADGQDSYPSSEQNGVQSAEWGSWNRSFTFAAAGSADAGASAAVSSTLPNAGSFPSGATYAFPDGVTATSEDSLLNLYMYESGRAFIQVYDTTDLFGDMDMGIDFMKSTYGTTAVTTWNAEQTADDFVDIEVNGRTISVLEFTGDQGGEPVVGVVAISPYTSGGYGYVIAYALEPVPEGFIADATAVATSLDK